MVQVNTPGPPCSVAPSGRASGLSLRIRQRYQAATDRYGRHGLGQPHHRARRRPPLHAEQLLHALDDAEIADRKDVRPVEPEHQEHLRRPAAESFHRGDRRDDVLVRLRLRAREIEPAVLHALGQVAQVAIFGRLTPARAKCGRIERAAALAGVSRLGRRPARRRGRRSCLRPCRTTAATGSRAPARRTARRVRASGSRQRPDALDERAEPRIAPHEQRDARARIRRR